MVLIELELGVSWLERRGKCYIVESLVLGEGRSDPVAAV